MNTNYISLNIVIPQPCTENWDGMSEREQGRFCGSCEKTVVDFSNMSVTETQQYITDHSDQHICGRFKSSQVMNEEIDRNMFLYKLYAVASGRNIRRNIVRYSFMLLIGALIGFAPSSNASAQSGTSEVRTLGTMVAVDPIHQVEPVKHTDTTKKTCDPSIKGDVAVVNVEPQQHMMMGGVSYRPEPVERPKRPKKPPIRKRVDTTFKEPEIMGKMSRPVDPPPDTTEEIMMVGEISVAPIAIAVDTVQLILPIIIDADTSDIIQALPPLPPIPLCPPIPDNEEPVQFIGPKIPTPEIE